MQDDFTRAWFPDAGGEVGDPVKAVQRAMRPMPVKRFYAQAVPEERDDAYVLTLDGRPAHTPARKLVAVPTRALGEALAAEWQAQGAEIDPAAMPLTRLVNSAIDGAAASPQSVIDDLVKYVRSDLICYRAGEPDRLVAEQAAAWDPIIAWVYDAFGARFVLSEGVTFVAQPDAAVSAMRAKFEDEESPFRLAALHVMTTISGSALIALAHASGHLSMEDAWAVAHVDERFQERVWGEDGDALRRRSGRKTDFEAASRLYALSRG